MMAEEQQRWDQRYASGEYRPRVDPSPIVDRAIDLIGTGRALVLACGAGRNALRLAEAGFEVVAVDISPVAIGLAKTEAAAREIDLDWVVADVDDFDLSAGRFDLITMIRYVNRSVWPDLLGGLAENGWLLMEQHLRTYREVIGPSGGYRVDPGELLDAFSSLRMVEYSELIEASDRTDGWVASARMLACLGDPGW